MTILNAVLGWVVDLLLAPFSHLPPVVGLAAVSLVTAVAMLLAFKRTSNQRAIAEEKRQLHAAIYEIRLFNDDLRAIARAQAEIARRNLRYLRLSFVPMLWVIVPLVLVIAQLQFRYGYTGLHPGEAVLVKAHLREPSGVTVEAHGKASTGRADVATLLVPGEVQVQTRAVWIPATREIIWRIVPRTTGEYALRVQLDGRELSKTLHVSGRVARRSPARLESGFVNQLLYPAEPPLPDDAPVTAISVAYPERRFDLFGWPLHWMVVYFALTILVALALRRPLGVTI